MVNAGAGRGAELDALAARLGTLARRDQPLGALTTYRVGGPASVMVEAASEDDLLAVRRALAAHPVPVVVVGRGSNMLVADAGFEGLAVRVALDGLEIPPPDPVAQDRGSGGGLRVVRAGGGVGLPVLARRTVEASLSGLEWAVGVPGSVGGAVRMNAGGHGSDTASVLVRCRWLALLGRGGGEDGPAALGLGYRRSSLGPSDVVVWAEFGLRPGDQVAGREAIAEIVRWRRQHQPGGSNAGSVFTNPPGDAAGRLVEAAGLKGFALGSARVSDKHANFIQADAGGSADDVRRLIDHVRAAVAERFSVDLVPEVRLIGFPEADNGAGGRDGDGDGAVSGSGP